MCSLAANKMSLYHNWAWSELWSLSWLSSLASESALWWSPTIPENSEGSSVPFFTCTSSFSLATAPCCPPFTRFHFIRLFWNHTFTWGYKKGQTCAIICSKIVSFAISFMFNSIVVNGKKKVYMIHQTRPLISCTLVLFIMWSEENIFFSF